MNLYQITAKTRHLVDGKMVTRVTESILRFPSKIEDVTNKQWCDFHTIRENAPKWFLQFEDMNPEQRPDEMATWTGAKWGEFYVVIAGLLMAFASVVESSTDDNSKPPTIDDIMKLGGNSDSGGSSLLAIYTNIVAMVLSYAPGNFNDTFTHRGKIFAYNKPLIDRWGNQWYGQTLSAGDAIEALQVEHVLNQKGADGQFLVANRRFHRDAALVAILTQRVLPDGNVEKMPVSTEERQSFLEKRIKFFEDVPVTVALNAAFFLQNSSNAFISTLTFRFASNLVAGQSTASQ